MPYVFYGTQYYVLYNFLTGSLQKFNYDENYIDQAILLGESVGNYHYCLKNIEIDDIQIFNLIDDVIRAYDYLLENNYRFGNGIVSDIMKEYKKYFVPVYNNLPQVFSHMKN